MKKIDDSDKVAIRNLVEEGVVKLGSLRKVSTACDVSPAIISNGVMKPSNWDNEYKPSDEMWVKVGKALGYKFNTDRWILAETSTFKLMQKKLKEAQEESLCIMISDKAGIGKTCSIEHYLRGDGESMVFVMQCEEWSKRQFILELCQALGIETKKGYQDVNILTKKIVGFFKNKASLGSPLLILDEVDKLKPGALRFIIPLYNKLEDECGIAICGTENLKKEVESGRRRAVKGYDEVFSRAGGTYIELGGSSKKDVELICKANGVDGQQDIDEIWGALDTKQKRIGNQYFIVCEELRRLKRLVKGYKIKQKNTGK
jgi:AAA domain